jgi:hypothetical protein
MTRRWEVKLPEPELLKTVGSNATILECEGRCAMKADGLKDQGSYTEGV